MRLQLSVLAAPRRTAPRRPTPQDRAVPQRYRRRRRQMKVVHHCVIMNIQRAPRLRGSAGTAESHCEKGSRLFASWCVPWRTPPPPPPPAPSLSCAVISPYSCSLVGSTPCGSFSIFPHTQKHPPPPGVATKHIPACSQGVVTINT